ncbi:hypothetical protein [Anabaena sp. UHCC 0204]|uniref:hypothetical protein n=1 Tax=Anabaena sp. UHCC 0204 TaxID=2590009 RepID=UPI001444F1AB|nr:hypothetical protein [Anabaena sp. UHCC 0204]MTJ08614.1 hypothetical protein [Anabaena sp. UHCC 0204]
MNIQKIWLLLIPYLMKMVKLEPFSHAVFGFLKNDLGIKFNISEVVKYSVFYFSILSLLVGFSTLPLSYNDNSFSYFGLEFPTSSLTASRNFGIELLQDFYLIGWLGISLLFLFGLLLPLGNSFLVNQTLWLRLTPCLPYEIAAARAIWVIIYALFMGLLSLIWAVLCTWINDFPLNSLLVDIEGLMSHILISGGMVVFIDFNIKNYLSRMFISIIAVVIPIILIIAYIPISLINSVGMITKFFPYTMPLALVKLLPDNQTHFLVTAGLGLLLLFLSVVIKFITINGLTFRKYLTFKFKGESLK